MNVYVVSAAELKENGGSFRVEPGPAVRVVQDDDAAEGDGATPVYIVTGRRTEGGEPVRVKVTTGRRVVGRVALPVYFEGEQPDSGGGEEEEEDSGFFFNSANNSQYVSLV